jgi:bacteriocin-like protein
MASVAKPINCITLQDLPAELVELSKEDLQHIVGGINITSRVVSEDYFPSVGFIPRCPPFIPWCPPWRPRKSL